MRSKRWISLVFLVVVSAAMAQDAPAPAAPPQVEAVAALDASGTPAATLTLRADLVTMPFMARDKQGFVADLTKSACRIEEKHTVHLLAGLSLERDRPLTLGILVDRSASQRKAIELERETGDLLLKQLAGPGNEEFLIGFAGDVDLLADVTDDAETVGRKLSRVEASEETGIAAEFGGAQDGTLLYDAVYLAANDLMEREAGRKVLVLLTDGYDDGSRMDRKAATEAALKANATVYVLAIGEARFDGGTRGHWGMGDVERMARETGGRVLEVGKDPRKLDEALATLREELRWQYLASFTPTAGDTDGGFHPVKVSCGKGRKVQAADGYFAVDAAAK
jgi:VWFA-related protein